MLKVSQELQQPCQAPQCAGVSSTGHWPVLSSPWGSDSTALARITFFSCCGAATARVSSCRARKIISQESTSQLCK